MTDDDRPRGPKGPGGGWDEPPTPCFGRPVQEHLCARLRDLYAALAPVPLPAHMHHLLDRLESREEPEPPD